MVQAPVPLEDQLVQVLKYQIYSVTILCNDFAVSARMHPCINVPKTQTNFAILQAPGHPRSIPEYKNSISYFQNIKCAFIKSVLQDHNEKFPWDMTDLINALSILALKPHWPDLVDQEIPVRGCWHGKC